MRHDVTGPVRINRFCHTVFGDQDGAVVAGRETLQQRVQTLGKHLPAQIGEAVPDLVGPREVPLLSGVISFLHERLDLGGDLEPFSGTAFEVEAEHPVPRLHQPVLGVIGNRRSFQLAENDERPRHVQIVRNGLTKAAIDVSRASVGRALETALRLPVRHALPEGPQARVRAL